MSFIGEFRQSTPKEKEIAPLPGNLTPGRPLRGASLSDFQGYAPRQFKLGQRNPVEILQTIATYNPDASMAVWNFVRLVNPDCDLRVMKFKGESQDKAGQDLLDTRVDGQFGDYGRDYGGGVGALIDVLVLTLVTQGAIAGELELSQNLKDVLDWCPVDPALFGFKRDDAGHWQMFVYVGGVERPLSLAQVRYIPLDPFVNDPYGRSPILPLLESVFFQTEVLRDLKAVAHTSGHPRMHFEILEEIAERHMPAALMVPGREEDRRKWMDAWLSEISDAYKLIQADDAFFTWDWVKVNSVSAGSSTFDPAKLVQIVEQQLISSLKHLPMLLGRLEGASLAHGTVQWQIFAETIKALRQPVETFVSWWGTQTLRIWGRPSKCVVEFPEIRTQDRVREAQAEALELETALKYWRLGFVKLDELSEKFVGHKPVAPPQDIMLGILPEEKTSEDTDEEGAAGEKKKPEEEEDGGKKMVRAETDYFDVLPVWMRRRASDTEAMIKARADSHRQDVLDSLMEIRSVTGNGHR